MAAVGGLDPSVLVAPDYQTQMLQAQRRLALADALRQQAMADTPGNGGSVSWTQGLARVLEGLASNSAAKRGYADMKGANQAYAAGMARMFGLPAPQTAAGAPGPASATPTPSAPQIAPQQAPAQPAAPFVPGAPVAPGQPDPLAPVAPPQVASQPPSAPAPAPTGGAYPLSLTGNPQKDFTLYMENPDEFSKAQIANAAKGAAPTDAEIMMNHARQAFASGDTATGQILAKQAYKLGYMEPINVRQGGAVLDPVTLQPKFVNPQLEKGMVADFGPNGMPDGAHVLPGFAEGNAAIEALEKGAVANVQSHYQLGNYFDPNTNTPRQAPVSGILGAYYGRGGPSGAGGAGVGLATGPQLGVADAASVYGKGAAQGALDTQGAANGSQVRVQAYREMEHLLDGGLQTSPARNRMQELAEEHGLNFLAQDDAFVFNKDSAIASAAQAQALGLNSSDARVSLVTQANPNLKMPPAALRKVLPVKIGMEYALQAQATANANWVAQHGPQSNPQFNNFWRQNYDPNMFTAYARGGAQALANAPTAQRQQWLREYRNLKSLGFDFRQLTQ